MQSLSRRGFLAASAALAAPLLLPRSLRAETPLRSLRATTRTLDIGGRAVSVKGILDDQGRSGLVLNPGEAFRVDLVNDLDTETILHWHGQIPPNAQDGVPDMPQPALAAGERRSFDFAATPGTHWMHSHIPVQEMELLAAPLIVRRPEDLAADRQEVLVLLHDLSFRPAEEVLAEITGGMGGMTHDMGGMAHGKEGMGHDMSGMMDGAVMGGMSMGAMDLNDFNFDAYLANDRTLDAPEVVAVDKGGRVLLRIINGSAATVFWIDTGALQGRAVATDGNPINPVAGTRFGLAMGQRLDIELDLPVEGGAFPVLALREGAVERTGIILASKGAAVERLSSLSDTTHPAFSADLEQEALFSAVKPLADRTVDRSDSLMLGGSMMPYLWTIDGQSWGTHRPVQARSGERVALTYHNMSMMAHPMHLHGHHFQVVALNGRAIAGALRDTVHVPPMSMVTVALDAGEAARWMLHCHHMPHLATGMMTEFVVSA
ncbi:multicopper oxidase family protein [Tabrizicola sp.]|uniref:multicopper oxidase family protein n=1 Tax=Tabrizicola sp. TaxID=2005166 RepID=UPI0027344130|nr:multicopper oxidase domain-containing protein [Tabrizicola sp.]MDP3195343.1 multicopper oxidase domain-containing protein [Tabrizicola sp.]